MKILAKAMIKQIDRVIGDLIKQTDQFRAAGGNPVCVGIGGVNHADREFLILQFKAWNEPPHRLAWVDQRKTLLDYGAVLTRVKRKYEARF